MGLNSGFSLGAPFSSTYKTDRYNITEILLKVALNTMGLNGIEWVKKQLIWVTFSFNYRQWRQPD